jgi:hypothetical protein
MKEITQMTAEELQAFFDALPERDDTAEIKEAARRYRESKQEADTLAGEGGLSRFLKTPLILGAAAAFIFLGWALYGTGASAIGGLTAILTGASMAPAAAVLFFKLQRIKPLYKEADKQREKLLDYIKQNTDTVGGKL